MNKTTRIGGIAIVIGVLAVIFAAFFFIFYPSINKPVVKLKLGDGVFDTSLAKNDIQRADAMADLSNLTSNRATILAYPYEFKWKIDMKDIDTSLDVVWLDKDKKVIFIVRNANPDDLVNKNKVFEPKSQAKYILFFTAGTVKNKLIDIDQLADFNVNEKEIK